MDTKRIRINQIQPVIQIDSMARIYSNYVDIQTMINLVIQTFQKYLNYEVIKCLIYDII